MRTALRIAITAATVFLAGAFLASPAGAQEDYEIQVYPYETVEPGHTMVELHNNFTFKGSKSTTDGTLPTNHQWHETIEITHGFNDWFEPASTFSLPCRRARVGTTSAAISVP